MAINWHTVAGTCLMALLLPAASAGEAPRYRVDVWGEDRGLPQSAVIALTQTRDGYLWLGTLNGLVRFDGLQFTVFDERNTPGLMSGPVVKLFEDSRGNLWVSTESAGVLLVREGRVVNLNIGVEGREGRVTSICEDPLGAVWLYAASGHLARYQDGRVEVAMLGSEAPSTCRALMVENPVGPSARAGSPVLWVGMDWKLYGLGLGTNVTAGQLPPVVFERVVRKLDGLLASREGGHWQLLNGRIQKVLGERVQDFAPYAWTWATPVNSLCEDQRGNLVVGTGGEGIFWFNPDGSFTHLTNAIDGLSFNTVLSLCLDREGNVWAGTDGGGLNRIKQEFFDVVPPSAGLVVKSVWPGAGGGLWIGYNNERIDFYAGDENRRFTDSQGLIDLNVRSVFVDHRQRVWAGTMGRGLLQLQNGLFLPAAESEFLRRDREISAIYEDRKKRLWVGTQDGLACWEGQRWSKLFTTRDGLSGNVVKAIAEDPQGNLWVGTQGAGLTLLHLAAANGDSAMPEIVGSRQFNRTNGLPSDNVSALFTDPAGVLWVGTASGLARYAAGKWACYTNRLGDASGSIGYLLEDDRGYLWIGSNAGLMRMLKKELNNFAEGISDSVSVRSYGKADGLPTRECSQGSQPAACRTPDGRLYFATIRGLVSVSPDHVRRNTNPPPVIIESVLVSGVPQGGNAVRGPVLKAVTIPARREGLEIDIAMINLSAPEQGAIRYRLEGHETAWKSAAGTTRWIRYSKLPPGRYEFRVQACNEDGLWNEAGSSLAVTVLPPFWRTWWFLTAVTLLILGMIIGSVHYVSTQRLQRQLATLRQQEALERERARIARDLHDQLGANLTQVALLGELAEADKDLPAEVESHARQISGTARETTRALDEIVWTVNPSNDTLEGLINYICKYAQEYLALAGLRYRLEVPPHLPVIPISPELRHNVFLVAKEAINNLVKHAGASSAWLRLELNSGSFILEIEDDGRGLKPADETKGRSGLKNMRKRMQDISGLFDLKAGANGGTLVRIVAPVKASIDGQIHE
jgi:ligand-binding sensor domain-containing protein/signal transduction histidine kinase